MSQNPAPKKVLAANIDEDTAPQHDLLITWASSIPSDRLQPLHEWLRSGSLTPGYNGPSPTYQLKLDWSDVEDEGPVTIVNRSMERCFGTRGVNGWAIWIRGDQLNLLVGDFRKEYLRIKALGDSQILILDLWVEGLLEEIKRM
jgi:hypothetical protein